MSKGSNKPGREGKKEKGVSKNQPTAYQKEKASAGGGKKRKHQRTT